MKEVKKMHIDVDLDRVRQDIEAAQARVEKAAEEHAAATTARDSCEPEEAIEKANDLLVAEARLRVARDGLEAARGTLRKAVDAANERRIAEARKVADLNHFREAICDHIERLKDIHRDGCDAVQQILEAIRLQNEAADIADLPAVTMSRARAEALAAIAEAPLPLVDVALGQWLDLLPRKVLLGHIREMCGFTRTCGSTLYGEDQIDLALSNFSDEAARLHAESTKVDRAEIRAFEEREAAERKAKTESFMGITRRENPRGMQ